MCAYVCDIQCSCGFGISDRAKSSCDLCSRAQATSGPNSLLYAATETLILPSCSQDTVSGAAFAPVQQLSFFFCPRHSRAIMYGAGLDVSFCPSPSISPSSPSQRSAFITAKCWKAMASHGSVSTWSTYCTTHPHIQALFWATPTWSDRPHASRRACSSTVMGLCAVNHNYGFAWTAYVCVVISRNRRCRVPQTTISVIFKRKKNTDSLVLT